MKSTLQFSLLQILTMLTSVAVVLSVLSFITAEWRIKTRIRDNVLMQGATWVAFARNRSVDHPNVVFSSPLQGDIQGFESFHIVELQSYDVLPTCINRLAKLRFVENLYFFDCKVSDDDLIDLTQLNVNNLLFWNTAVSDVDIPTIAKISALKKVSFKTTNVSEDGIRRLRELRPDMVINYLK